MEADLKATVRANLRRMTLQLAQELGVPEAEVIRAYPEDRVRELDGARWREIVERFESLGAVRVIVSNGAATVEVEGTFGNLSTTGPFFNVQTDSLDMHIRWQELGPIFAVRKPGHMDGTETLSVQFYDRQGSAAFKVFLNFGSKASVEHQSWFDELSRQFGLGGGM